MTQVRPRIDEDLAAEVRAYGDSLRLNFESAVRILLRHGLLTAPRDSAAIIAALTPATPAKGDGNDENDS